jgi:putative phage-type endonuclease
MDQRTDNWLEWRNKGIGGSDAPIIMGVSPWKTPRQLWEEKTGKVKKEDQGNWATERGNRLEPIARAKYELMSDIEMGPATCQHIKYEFLRASMDGWNPQKKRGLEIKFAGRADHEGARAGKVPDKYYPQVQHQIFVTGAEVVDYASYYVPKGALDHQGELLIVEVKPDLEYLKAYLRVAIKFWECVTTGVAPDFIADDFKVIRLIVARKAAEEWKRLSRELAALETKLLEYGNRVHFQGTGVRIVENKIEVVQEEAKEENG